MSQMNKTFIAGLSALAACMTASMAYAGVGGTELPPVIRGERAPAIPFSVNTYPNESSPFAFADFPDLPGYLPPANDDKEDRDETEEVLGGFISDGLIAFGEPKHLPPTTEQQFDLPFPNWDGDIIDPLRPRYTTPFDAGLDLHGREPADTHSIPAPGSLILVIAGAAATGRRRR